MQKMCWKRLASGMLAVLLCISVLLTAFYSMGTVTAQAASSHPNSYGAVNYELDVLGNITITGGAAVKEIEIPEMINGRVVTKIDNGAFRDNRTLEKITIPDSVISIGRYAFQNCVSLKTIEGAEGVTDMGDKTFLNTAWKNQCQDEVVVLNGKIAVALNTAATHVTIPEGVTILADYLFSDGDRNVMTVDLPQSLTVLGSGCFMYCENLQEIMFPRNLKQISFWSFYGCKSLKSVSIPQNIYQIEGGAFESCTSLESVTIGENVRLIGNNAFQDCTSLLQIKLPDSVTRIGEESFYGCSSLESVTFGNSLTDIGAYAFCGCTSLRAAELPDGLCSIGSYAFSLCTSLSDITLPHTLEDLGEEVFLQTAWMEQQTGSWIVLSGILLKYRGNRSKIEIPENVCVISNGFLENPASVNEITLPAQMEEISKGAFQGCTSLRKV